MPTPFPKDPDDHQGLLAFVEDKLRVSQQQRWLYEWQQYQNILFYLGVQWVAFDAVLGTIIPVPTRPKAPRPVFNKFAEVLRPLASLLAAEEPNLYFRPMTDLPADVATAHAATRALDILYGETGMREHRPVLARWATLTGNAFLISGYDTSQRHGRTTVQNWRCLVCDKDAAPLDVEQAAGCPTCGQPADMMVPSRDAQGTPRVTTYARGRVYTDIAPLFEMHFDWQAGYLDRSPWIIRERSVPRSHVLDLYGAKAEGLATDTAGAPQRRYLLESLAYATAGGGSLLGAHGAATDEDRVQHRQIWLEHPHYPQGLYAETSGSTVLYAQPAPYQRADSPPDDPRPLRPVVHVQYEAVPGRVWGKTPADDLVGPQRFRNRLLASLELHMRRAANTVWTAPDGSHVKKLSGEQGVLLTYNTLAGGQPPTRLPGAELSQTHWQAFEFIDRAMEAMAGTMDVLRGEAPPRVTAYSAIQLLEQRAQQNLAEGIVNWSLAHRAWAMQVLSIFRRYGVDARFSAAAGENGHWAIQKLTAADLRGAMQVEVEAGLGRPRTQIAKRAVVEQGIRVGAVNMMDPMERFAVVRILGIPELLKDQDLDIQAAAIENDTFMELAKTVQQGADPAGVPWPEVRSAIDNHPLHLHSHRRVAITEAFRAWPKVVQRIFEIHTLAHQAAIAAIYGQVQGQGAPSPRAQLTGPGPTGEGLPVTGGETESLRADRVGLRQEAIGFPGLPGGGVPERTGRR